MELTAEDLRVVIDGVPVLDGVDLTCAPGRMTVLVGPSGSGKTTLLNCLGLLQVPSSGRVLVDGTDTTAWRSGRRRRFWRDHSAFVLQDTGIMDEESVALNVTMRAGVLTNRARGDRARMLDALGVAGLAGRQEERAAHLSGGEKHRLAIARAVYKDARVLYVDEPTASLDDANRRTVIDLLVARARAGCTVVVATHDDDVVAAADTQYTVGARRAAVAAAVQP
ncbi:ABC transporter ATP-binding protein [Cellulomonas phragmiteti]|uniref:ABC transporter domain-containing protein n=1 Tax=Cellulomonas phragmiteti TaxID=478780 RepID=A0ABQ4DQG5_9CELL|nr:ATP-binding cassette domain-containing protein [Cellulomonas phragmiteti]GIG41591.1 hypothetical protein Cph01nite_33530 [Cellulomonas phragmiteti]